MPANRSGVSASSGSSPVRIIRTSNSLPSSASVDRTRQAAVIVDGVVSHVTVTDLHYALSGQRLSLVSLHSARGPTFLLVTAAPCIRPAPYQRAHKQEQAGGMSLSDKKRPPRRAA